MKIFQCIAKSGCAVIMSTHNISLLEQFPSRTILFSQGRIQEVDVRSVVGEE
jgi:cell division transport system ATP-binding protein